MIMALLVIPEFKIDKNVASSVNINTNSLTYLVILPLFYLSLFCELFFIL